MTTKPQAAARRILRDAARTATIRVTLDAGNARDGEVRLAGRVIAQRYSRDGEVILDPAAVIVDGEFAATGGYQAADDPDDPTASYGDVSLRHVTRVRRADRARIATLIGFLLEQAGYDPAEFSIGGDPR